MREEEPLWRIELFGGLQAHRGPHALERLPTQKTAGLLAILAYALGRRQTRERLVDVLWPDAESASGRDRLSQALVWLRPRLEPGLTPRGSVLQADRANVGLNPSAVTTDVAQFEAALSAAAQAATPAARREALEEAITQYKGELLPGIYSDWVFPERQRHLSSYLLSLAQLSRLYEDAGDFVRALDCGRCALIAEPLHEEAHRDLIRLLAATGRKSAALLQFQELKILLAREMEAEPSAETLALVEQVQRRAAPRQRHTPGPPLAKPADAAHPFLRARSRDRRCPCSHRERGSASRDAARDRRRGKDPAGSCRCR